MLSRQGISFFSRDKHGGATGGGAQALVQAAVAAGAAQLCRLLEEGYQGGQPVSGVIEWG